MGKQSNKKKKRSDEQSPRDILKSQRTDMSYWGQPLWYRIYMRVFYAIGAFIITASFFDIYTVAPLWFQILMGALVAVSVLLFRIAYPNGLSGIWQWILEGMREAAEDQAKNGKVKKGNFTIEDVKRMQDGTPMQVILAEKNEENNKKAQKNGKGE